MTKKIYGVDLGTSQIKIYKKGKGIVAKEKNLIAVKDRKSVLAIGDEAFDMYEKAPENVDVTYPVRNGVIADIDRMEKLFSCLIRKMNNGSKSLSGIFIMAIPTDITEVEKKAFTNLVEASIAKVKDVKVVEKPIAAALGADLDITNAKGVLMVDIGAATTEVAVISLGGIVISKLLPIGGDTLDEAIINIIKKECNLLIGSKTAEKIKKTLGCAYGLDDTKDEVSFRKSSYKGNILEEAAKDESVEEYEEYDESKEFSDEYEEVESDYDNDEYEEVESEYDNDEYDEVESECDEEYEDEDMTEYEDERENSVEFSKTNNSSYDKHTKEEVERLNDVTMKVYGRNVVSGLPEQITVRASLVHEAIREHLNSIVDSVKQILERTPPEISADIIDTGLYISGGSANVNLLDKLLEEQTELEVNVCNEPESSVIRGLGRIIEEPALFELAGDPKRPIRR